MEYDKCPQVGADGFNSPVRSYAGISSYGWSYDAQAIVATLSHLPKASFQASNNVAYQRFLPTGPIAFLPLSPTESSLVWSTKPALAHALSKSEPAVLANMINAAFRLPAISMHYLHNIILETLAGGSYITPTQIHNEISWRERSHHIDAHSAYASVSSVQDVGIPPADSDALPPLVTSIQPGSIASFPLRFNHADSYIGEGAGSRTVLIGDAAHTVHPLAGQGLNMGLGDVECLYRCIQNAVLYGGDVGGHALIFVIESRS
jgi:ubiquinone biosynthesis monooxygenase Coq6